MEYETLSNEYQSLTTSEKLLLASRPWIIDDIKEYAKMADEKTKALFGYSMRNDPSDAFRHCYFSALLVANIGFHNARDFMTAHELFDANPHQELNMDLSNNAIGLRIGMYGGDSHSLAGQCMAALRNGKLKVIRK